MNWQELSALLVLASAMSFTPGPNTTLSTALAANRGLRHALPFVFAVPLGWCALLLVCAQAVAYLELRVGQRTLFGVGMDANIVSASLKAIVSGLQRAQAGDSGDKTKEKSWQTN